jgi:hypothetical protein
MTKFDGLIKKIYYDSAGFGTVQETYKDVKKLDSTITINNVRDWYERNIERKKQLRGFNSYISKGPRDEYEVDLFDVNYLGQKEYRYGFLAIDNFTKMMWVVPVSAKYGENFIEAMEAVIASIMGKPRKIYSDEEPSMVLSVQFKKWLDKNNILHITTRTHANTAERAIRTFKDLMTRRLAAPGNEDVEGPNGTFGSVGVGSRGDV